MSFLSSLYSKIFKQDDKKSAIKLQSTILLPENYSVRHQEIDALIYRDSSGKFCVHPIHLAMNLNTVNSQLKLIYVLHTLLLHNNGQISACVSTWIDNGEIKLPKVDSEEITNPRHFAVCKTQQVGLNKTQIVEGNDGLENVGQPQLSVNVSLNDVKLNLMKMPQRHSYYELEEAFVTFYFNYIQRLSWGYDVHQSCRSKQYPYGPDIFLEAKQKFLWLYKIINLLNYQISGVQLIKYNLKQQSFNSQIIRNIAGLILSDCLIEYQFLANEIQDMVDTVSSLHVSDGNPFQLSKALQFYEIYQILMHQTRVLKDFDSQKDVQQFGQATQSSQVQWFHVTKEQKRDLDDYINKVKLLHTGKFRKSLNVPTKNVALEALRTQLMQYQLDPKPKRGLIGKPNDFFTSKHSQGQKFDFRLDGFNALLSPEKKRINIENEIHLTKQKIKLKSPEATQDEEISIIEEHAVTIKQNSQAELQAHNQTLGEQEYQSEPDQEEHSVQEEQGQGDKVYLENHTNGNPFDENDFHYEKKPQAKIVLSDHHVEATEIQEQKQQQPEKILQS